MRILKFTPHTMKHLLLLVTMLFCSVSSVLADDSELITKQITVNVSKAGTLKDKIGSSKKYRITSLKVTGELDVDDIQFIREMSGCYSAASSSADGGKTWKHEFDNGNLQYLDIKDVQFVNKKNAFNHENQYIYVYKETGEFGKRAEVIVHNTDEVVIEGLFYNLPNIKSIILPDNITAIGTGTFEGCSSLAKLDIPLGVTSFSSSAFKGCSSLENIRIPNEEQYISGSVFEGCSNLTSIVIPSKVKSIDSHAFKNCSGLKNIFVYMPTPPKVEQGAFDGVDKETCTLYVPKGTYDEYWLVEGFGDFKNIVEFDANALDLTTGTFTYNSNRSGSLSSLGVAGMLNSVGIDRNFKTTIKNLKLSGSLNINDMKVIRELDAEGLENLDLKNATFEGTEDVTVTGQWAGTPLDLQVSFDKGLFSYLYNLQNIVLPDNLTSISEEMFAYNYCLKSVTIPASVNEIGKLAFYTCMGLEKLYIYSNKLIPVDYEGTLKGPENCTLYVPQGLAEAYRTSIWGEYLQNIEEMTTTGIKTVSATSDVKEVSRYSIAGQKLDAPVKGLNIVKYSDGSIKKVAVQ